MAAKKSPGTKPAHKPRAVAQPAAARIDALEATVEELSEVVRALMRDSATAGRYVTSNELRLRGIERKLRLRK